MADDKFNVYSHVTAAIVSAMQSGTAPWRKPWTGSTGGVSIPLRSNGEAYRGINVLMLWIEASEKGYVSARWFTYKQAQELGGQVRKGEKSATIVKYGTFEKEDRESGAEKRFAYAKAYRVFNADQIDGLPAEFYSKPLEAPCDLGTEADAALDAFFAATGATMTSTDTPRAYYNSKDDFIHMPPIATFHSASGYYATLAHEITHWTGHASRLDRFNKPDRRAYAFEELVAEIGNCMLCATLGFAPDFDQSASYLAGWLEALQNDERLIFKAASDAQKAVDYIMAAAGDKTEKKVAA